MTCYMCDRKHNLQLKDTLLFGHTYQVLGWNGRSFDIAIVNADDGYYHHMMEFEPEHCPFCGDNLKSRELKKR